jgi:hypothetical protein
MNKKQIVVVAAVVGVTVYLLSLPAKPIVLEKAKADSQGTGMVAQAQQQNRQITNVTVDAVSASAKTLIPSAAATNIASLESQLKQAAAEQDKLALQQKLASAWDAVNQPAPAAFYYLDIASKQNTAKDWVAAGNHFNDAYKLTDDTTAQPFFDARAMEAFQNALKLQPESLDAQTGLGIADVNGGGPPMQGIALLLGVVAKEPKNYNANFNLGMFSMKSGQFDKAVGRFKTASEVKPNDIEPVFYLAETYRQLGMKKEAVDAYMKCKKLTSDPIFNQKIDQYIKELSN